VGEIISESVGGIIPERWATSAGIGIWRASVRYGFMERPVTDYFNLPGDQVVEIGRQIAI
jgi:hypothetical protein